MATGKKYDIVVFGATGFTGQYVLDEVAKAATEDDITFAVAGRNMSKLQKILAESSKRVDRNIEETPIIVADTSSYKSLVEMAQQTKVVLNCVGPYTLYGEVVIKACIEAGAHQLDLSGEQHFLEKTQLMYNGKAKENGVYIMGATGVGSVIQEMGLSYARQQMDGDVVCLESYMSMNFGPKGYKFHTTTLESMGHAIAHMKEAAATRNSLYPDPLPAYDYCLPKRSPLFFSKEVNKWCIPFPDESSTTRTLRDLLTTKRINKPYEYKAYVGLDSLAQALGYLFMLLVIGIMSMCSVGRSLLLKFPGVFTFGMFSKEGPSREQIEGATFSLTVMGHGYKEVSKDRTDKTPDKVVMTKLVGPEPGYTVTAICMVQCAVTLLKEADKIYHKEGGVFSPGAIYEDTSLVERLRKHNMQISTVE